LGDYDGPEARGGFGGAKGLVGEDDDETVKAYMARLVGGDLLSLGYSCVSTIWTGLGRV
jgi:hypothetical protein